MGDREAILEPDDDDNNKESSSALEDSLFFD